jgi:cytochrome c-type biogenesis protein CcmF
MIPIGLAILFLTGVGPLLAWRKTSVDSMKRNFGWPLVAGAVGGAIFFALGYREVASQVCLFLCVFVTATIFMEFYRGAKVISARTGMSMMMSAHELAMRNTRRYGGYVVHFGMVLIFIGLAGAAFNKDVQKTMNLGDSMQLGPYTLVLQSGDTKVERNYTAERMIVEVLKNNKQIMMLYPEKRNFQANQESGTMVSIYSSLREDLYVVYAGQDPDSGMPVIHAYLNPLVKWVWLGGVIVVFGTLLALMPNRRAALALPATQETSPATAAVQGLQPSITLREGHD